MLSGVCVLVGVTTTHGLGGQLRHASPGEAGAEIMQGWRFFQPFQCAHSPLRPARAPHTLLSQPASRPWPALTKTSPCYPLQRQYRPDYYHVQHAVNLPCPACTS